MTDVSTEPAGLDPESGSGLTISRGGRRAVIGVALALLVAGVIALAWPGSDDEGTNDASAADPAAPVESELPSESFELFDGGEATFADFEGSPLVVNFWASWCPACVGELPEFQQVHEERSDEVTFIGIANTDLRGPALDLAGSVGLTYDLADDPNGDLFREFELIAMPSTLFVDENGQIVEVFAGALDESALNARIDELLGS
jgi:thiol-disulfide isomerase/thioredoxin